jgi:hypothetical protein
MRFLHDFGDGIRAELILTDAPPTKGGSPLIRCDWCGGRPSLQHLEQYLRWTKEVYQTAADHWDIKLAHVVQTDPERWECWGFEAKHQTSTPRSNRTMSANTDSSTLERNGAAIKAAKDSLRIPELWRLCGFEGNPSACCQSPFRADRKPSFSVYADGLRWKDFASGEEGDAIDFLGKARDLENGRAVREFLALALVRGSVSRVVSEPPFNRVEERRPDLSRFRLGSAVEIEAVAKSRGIDPRAICLAQEMGCLLFGSVYGLPSWILTDVSGRCAEARRIDRLPYPADTTKAERKAHSLIGSPKSWPVGCLISSQYRNPGNTIALVEGGPDYLAILHLALRAGRVDIQPVAVLGRSQCIHGFHPDSVELFRRHRVRIFPHADIDGQGVARALFWARHLEKLNCQVDLFRLEGLTKADGTKVNDLNDLVELHPAQANELEGIFP